jgi:ribonuclease/clavin/mitogillin
MHATTIRRLTITITTSTRSGTARLTRTSRLLLLPSKRHIQSSAQPKLHPSNNTTTTNQSPPKMTSPLPDLPPITRLSPSIIRILGHNPSKFTLQGTNTYLLGTGPSRILIDTAEGKPEWREALQKVLQDEKASIETVLLTHWHHDHVGGVAHVRELQPEEGVEVKKFVAPSSASGKHEERGSEDWGVIEDGEVFSCEGVRLRALYSPGHTDDHVGFVLENESGDGEGDDLFAGDNVLGHGTAVFEDLALYMESLEKMRGVVGGRLFPGHGEVVEDGKGKIAEYVEHRRAREREALEVLGRARKDGGGEGWGSMELVKVIYSKYPEALHGPAEGSLKHVLKKLHGEGKVKEERTRWFLVGKEEGRL